MGIPALFKWLSNKYPKIVTNVIEEAPKTVNNETIPVDASQRNPNGLEIDNLYLDMNGIIHPCCHPEDKPAPTTEEEMYIEIFKYIDRIFAMIRPRKLLYMAIDGVAPRAKMNQQRSRRFRAAQEEEQKRIDEERARLEWGEDNPKEEEKKHFDSNCITPGTPFMDQLAICLRYYITDRLNNDPGWKDIQVILSDASVPGEGEHKIMDYIRRQKMQPTFDPNIRHVLYGLDADLIMLALATHEPNFWILREDVSFNNAKQRACPTCGQSGHDAFQCQGAVKERIGQWDDQSKYLDQKPFIFVHISVLREYLDVEMKLIDIPFEWSLERAIDDWIFMCFFVGNDFLPHLPSLEIREGAVDLLIGIWKSQARSWDGYLTDSGEIRLDRVQTIMEELGAVEDATFQKRRVDEEQRRMSRLQRKREKKYGKDWKTRIGFKENNTPGTLRKAEAALDVQMNEIELFSVKNGPPPSKRTFQQSQEALKPRFSHKNPSASANDNIAAAKKLKLQLMAKTSLPKPTSGFSLADFQAPIIPVAAEIEVEEEVLVEGNAVGITPNASQEAEIEEKVTEEVLVEGAVIGEIVEPSEEPEIEEVIEEVEVDGILIPVKDDDSDAEEPADNIRLWESGWKTRYYEKKFGVDVGDEVFRSKVVQSYIEGLCWVLKYYYQGVQSWKWFYPYHYSPFASDFRNIGEIQVTFEKSVPFKPIEQLMGVFPAASKSHIPKPFHFLMTDESSPIIDFYPTEFPIDLNGKKYAWQGVALLPFIDADRLLKEITPLYAQLTEDEQRRNSLGNEILFSSSQLPAYEEMCSLYGTLKLEKPLVMNPAKTHRICGSMSKDDNVCFPGTTYHSPLLELNMPDIENSSSISVCYHMPLIPSNYKHLAQLLPNSTLPAMILNDDDRYAVRMGYTSRGRGGYRGGRGRGAVIAHRMVRHGLALSREQRKDTWNERNQSPIRNDQCGDRNQRYSRDSPPQNRQRNYDDNRTRYDNRRDYQNSDFRTQDRPTNYGDRRNYSYDRRAYRDEPYMGGGGYSNRDRFGKQRSSGYDAPDQDYRRYDSQNNDFNSGSYNRNRRFDQNPPRYEQNRDYSNQRDRNYSYSQNYNQQQNYSNYQGNAEYAASNPQSQQNATQGSVVPMSEGAALVASLLAQLPGGSAYTVHMPSSAYPPIRKPEQRK